MKKHKHKWQRIPLAEIIHSSLGRSQVKAICVICLEKRYLENTTTKINYAISGTCPLHQCKNCSAILPDTQVKQELLKGIKTEIKKLMVDSARESQYKEGLVDGTKRAIIIINEALKKEMGK